jgi:hypothetical protein
MESKRFQKRVENFVCEHCGYEVEGSGYTNHCPKCLWSKHVDVNPGDRLATCGGLMEPIAVNLENGDYVLTHKCQNCGELKKNIVCKDDDFDKVVEIASIMTEKESKKLGVANPINSVSTAPLGLGQQPIENHQPVVSSQTTNIV